MAEQAHTTPTAGATPLAHLLPRRAGIQTAISALEPLLMATSERPSPLYSGLQTIFDQLIDELWAIDQVILSLDPISADELHAQAAIARASIEEHLPNMPLLRDFLERAEAFAA